MLLLLTRIRREGGGCRFTYSKCVIPLDTTQKILEGATVIEERVTRNHRHTTLKDMTFLRGGDIYRTAQGYAYITAKQNGAPNMPFPAVRPSAPWLAGHTLASD